MEGHEEPMIDVVDGHKRNWRTEYAPELDELRDTHGLHLSTGSERQRSFVVTDHALDKLIEAAREAGKREAVQVVLAEGPKKIKKAPPPHLVSKSETTPKR